MSDSTRRTFLQRSSLGLAMAGAGSLILRADAQATPAVAGDESGRVLIQMGVPPAESIAAPGEFKKIVPIGEGPWYKPGAPFRGKLCPPGEPGTTFILTGRIWALDTRRPLPGVVLDVWHVGMNEQYSDGVSDFRNRGRIVTNEVGLYEFESIRPIPYRPNPSNSAVWRCAHFHLKAVRPAYKPLVTEIHFKDDPKRNDPMYRLENTIAPEKRSANGVTFETAVFDIVLERDAGSK
jgi:protocatechuate 3,4-dioxygenase beta subunit